MDRNASPPHLSFSFSLPFSIPSSLPPSLLFPFLHVLSLFFTFYLFFPLSAIPMNSKEVPVIINKVICWKWGEMLCP